MPHYKPILLVDFDGVLHSYISGWQGADVVGDPAVPGADKFIREAACVFSVHVYSSRTGQSGGIEAMRKWMDKELGSDVTALVQFPTEKPPAFLTLDDRAICFTGTWPDPAVLLLFRPWNKRSSSDFERSG